MGHILHECEDQKDPDGPAESATQPHLYSDRIEERLHECSIEGLPAESCSWTDFVLQCDVRKDVELAARHDFWNRAAEYL